MSPTVAAARLSAVPSFVANAIPNPLTQNSERHDEHTMSQLLSYAFTILTAVEAGYETIVNGGAVPIPALDFTIPFVNLKVKLSGASVSKA